MSKSNPNTESFTAAHLKNLLTSAPLTYRSKSQSERENEILTHCYRSLWSNNSQWLQTYFFSEGLSDDTSLISLLEKNNLLGTKKQDISDNESEEDSSSQNTNEEHYENQREGPCGHLFKRGESVYHCRNCAFDDTCVMCSKCFHATDHEGHDIKIWIGRGAGCCDCGDPEAWEVPLNCKIHSRGVTSAKVPNKPTQLAPLSSVPVDVLNSIRGTISTVIDYALETFAASIEDVMSIGTVESVKQDCIESHQALGLPIDLKTQIYTCVLWNDEQHSFDSVISILQDAVNCSVEESEALTHAVNSYGRQAVKQSDDIQSLINVAEIINSIGLSATITTEQKLSREEISGLLLSWLKELVSGRCKFFNSVEGGNCIIRDIVCEVLSTDWALLPDLARLSIRHRRAKMPVDLDDSINFDEEEGVMHGEPIDEEDDDMMIFDPEDGLITTEFFNAVNMQNIDEDEDLPLNSEVERRVNVLIDNGSFDFAAYLDGNEDVLEPEEEIYVDGRKRRRSSSSESKTQKTQKCGDILDTSWGLETWLENTEKLELAEKQIAKDLRVPELSEETTSKDIRDNIVIEFKRKLRLDYLLQFDLRLWKTARMDIKDLLISTFISNFQYRPVLGTRFARNYPELVDAFFFKDREPENSVGTLSVQLLTVPTVAAILVKEYKFFGMICSILANFFLTDNIDLNLPKGFSQDQVDSSSRAISRHRYAYTIYDLRYLMNAEQVKLEITKNILNLRHFLDMLNQFQGMDPLKHQTDSHVTYESDTWVHAFNATLQIAKLCRLYAACYDTPQSETTASESCYNLCRTIHRVLKAICDWDIQSTVQTPSIKGLFQQDYHKIDTRHAGTIKIVNYNVLKEPVSFHNPFHWLLSELFENVSILDDGLLEQINRPGGLKNMINNACILDGKSSFLEILEFPIRTLAILSQINCGVWVRNGYSIRNQSHTYKDINVRENTLDRDIYLLQVGFIVCESNHLLLTLIDRFQLGEWFGDNPDKEHSVYDRPQNTFMVEELLNLLIINATEHTFASGTKTEQRVQRAIIQYLGLTRLSYSELLKLIPESLNEHSSFEVELNKVANFRAPDGISDKGMYELKPEFLDQVDPYFWHYTRNKREEAHVVLKQRWNQLHPEMKLNDKDEFLNQPKIHRIESGPFKHLTNFLHSVTFNQILTYGLWNSVMSKNCKSEVVLDEVLYLGMLAVTDTNNTLADHSINQSQKPESFFKNAASDKYSLRVNKNQVVDCCLLDVLLRFLSNNDLSHAHKRLEFILKKIKENSSEQVKAVIHQWEQEKSKLVKPQDHSNVLNTGPSEYEKKKAAAKARQMTIMSQFAMAQSKFMEQHADLYTNEENEETKNVEVVENSVFPGNDSEIIRKCFFQADNCIVCQESLDGTKLHGMLGLVQKSNIQRSSPVTKDVWTDILETGSHLNNPWGSVNEESTEKGASFSNFPTTAHSTGIDISSCGHLMHAECFKAYQKSVEAQNRRTNNFLEEEVVSTKERFLCPFCKALGNVLVPVVWRGKKEAYPGVMQPTTPYERIVEELESFKNNFEKERMSSATVDQDSSNLTICDKKNLKDQYLVFSKIIHSTLFGDRKEFDVNVQDSLSLIYDMYAYTIGNLEISQRGAENTRAKDLTVEHTGTFVDDLSATSQTFLKTLALTNDILPRLEDTYWVPKKNHQRLNQLLPDGHGIEKPLLIDDPFKILVHLDFSAVIYNGVQVHHLMRALYLAELAKNLIGIAQAIYSDEKVFKDNRLSHLLNNISNVQHDLMEVASVEKFVNHILELVQFPNRQKVYEKLNAKGFAALLRLFTLPYLRKSLLLMITHHGFIPQNSEDHTETNEYDSLLNTLELPKFKSIFDMVTVEKKLLASWCTDYLSKGSMQIPMNLPTKYRLANLPYRLDNLLDECSKRICRKCNDIPAHAAICLICGSFVCARSFCCTEVGRGECNNHLER